MDISPHHASSPQKGAATTEGPRDLGRRAVALAARGIGRPAGLLCLLIGLLQYRSDNATVLGLWSVTFVLFLVALSTLIVFTTWNAVRRRASAFSETTAVGVAAFDASVFLWGAAYLLSALRAPEDASQLLDANVLGSTVPVAVVLNWIVLLFLLIPVAVAVTRLGGAAQKLALSLFAAGVVLVLGEGVVRMRALLEPVPQGFPTNTSRMWLDRHVTLNSLGFRDDEPHIPRTPGVRRLLIIGDSYGFGIGIDRREDRFGELLTRRLPELTGLSWESINASQPDRHTLHELATLRCMMQFQPDMVVLLYVFNDIDYLSPVTQRGVLTNAPRGILERLHPLRALFLNSFLFQELYVRLRGMWSQGGGPLPSDPYTDVALLDRHLRDVAAFTTFVNESGAAVAVVPFDLSQRANEGYQRRYDRFVSSAMAANIPIVSLASAFDAHNFSQLILNPLDGHPNALANKLAVDAAAVPLANIFKNQPRAGEPPMVAQEPQACLAASRN